MAYTYTPDPLQALLWVKDGYPGRGYEFRKWELGETREITYRFVSNNDESDKAFIESLKAAISSDKYLTQEVKNLTIAGLDKGTAETGYQKTAIKSVLDSISSMLNITFREVTAANENAQITFSNAPTINKASAQTVYLIGKDDNNGKEQLEHAVVFFAGTGNENDWKDGGGGKGTALHEIAHALGLKGTIEEETEKGMVKFMLDEKLNTIHNTAMSYFKAGGTVYPSTLMPMDIEALKELLCRVPPDCKPS